MDVWPLVPARDCTEQLSWLTDIGEAYSAEMRHSLRGGRRLLQYDYPMVRDHLRAEALLRAAPIADWLVPVWTESSRPGPIGATDTVIAVDQLADWGAQALLWGGCDDYLVVDIAEAVEGSLTLAEPVGRAFLDPLVMPVEPGVIATQAGLGRRSRRITAMTVDFLLRRDAGLSGAPYPLYLGLPYLACAGAVPAALSGSLAQPVEYVDTGLGPVVIEPMRSILDALYTVEIRQTAQADRFALRQFLGDVRGRDGAFWVPAWGGRLRVISGGVAASTSVGVAPLFATAAEYVGRHIRIGSEFRVVTAAVLTSELVHTLTVAALTGPAVSGDLLRRVRLDTDVISIGHRMGFSARTGFTVKEVQA